MDRRREMARRLVPVLLLVVVIVASVGVMEGNGADGKESGKEEMGAGRTLGEKVLPWATIGWAVMIGLLMWRLGREQKKIAQGQILWQRKFGERQLKQERELAEREEWFASGQERQMAVRAVMEYLERAGKIEELGLRETMLFWVEGAAKRGLFEKEEGDLLLEVGKKGRELNEAMGKLRGELAGLEGLQEKVEAMKRVETKCVEIQKWIVGAVGRLSEACWQRRKS